MSGFDLCSAYDTIVPARGKALVKTDLSIAIPENTYARIAPRSGLALKNFIDTGAGVVDYDYRGPVGVVLFNHGETDFEIKRGDRIAQLILGKNSLSLCCIEYNILIDTVNTRHYLFDSYYIRWHIRTPTFLITFNLVAIIPRTYLYGKYRGGSGALSHNQRGGWLRFYRCFRLRSRPG